MGQKGTPMEHKPRKSSHSSADIPAGRNRKGFGGRPRKHESEAGEKLHLGIRVTPEMKQRLEAVAAANGRSQSQEAEIRLQRTFDRQDLLVEVLTVGFGKELAGILMMLGVAMLWAGYAHP